MTQMADSQIIASVFLRKGGEGLKTKLFENLAAVEKSAILSRAALASEEEPVIAYFATATDWFLITTQRLVWSNSEGLHAMRILQFDYAESNFEAAWERWQIADDREIRDPNMDIDELFLVTIDGKRTAISLEPGQPYLGISNALMWLSRWAKSQREAA